MTVRRRLDSELVRRGLVPSRTAAQAAIADHLVTVGGSIAGKPSHLVAPGDPVELLGPPARFVGRGGEKLDAALERFGLDVRGVRALDAGASTGGFTDCLLQRGAAQVVAVDVGHGQLHPDVRADPRVDVRERCNVRHLTREAIGGAGRPGGGRPLLHLPDGRAAGAPRRRRARRPARAAGQAPVRGRPGGGLARGTASCATRRSARRCRPASMTPCARVGRPSWAGWNPPCAARTATWSCSSTRSAPPAPAEVGHGDGRGAPVTRAAVIVAHHERAEAAALGVERVQVAGRPRLHGLDAAGRRRGPRPRRPGRCALARRGRPGHQPGWGRNDAADGRAARRLAHRHPGRQRRPARLPRRRSSRAPCAARSTATAPASTRSSSG